ncbi:MAG TPA: inorganic diphosphatase [Minicystis sp.]|nr:inorganic diphosphatase [Minicystis sp.]
MKLDKLSPRDEDGAVRVVVESPRGSPVKLKYEPELGAFTLSRPLVLGVHYPFDWGFVPGTRAPDGDPLDAMVLLDACTYPGVVLEGRPVGVVEITQRAEGGDGRERNDRLVVAPSKAPRFDGLRDARDLPARVREEIEAFFRAAVLLEEKGLELLGWGGPDEAEEVLEAAIRAASRKGKAA